VLSKYDAGPRSGVFTDGSAVPNPGPGGWGAVWVEAGEIRGQRHGHDPETTNNRMELRALTEAFQMLPEDAVAEVRTDSRLCVDTITKWAPAWERKGWKKKTGPIKNLELVQELLALYRAHPQCKLLWIAAHSGNRWNEYADSLATSWMRAEL
jgi:ribonuclease HI